MSGAFDLGAVVAHIKADTKDFENGMRSAQGEINNFKSRMSGVGDVIKNVGAQAAVFTAAVGTGVGFFLKSASQEANNFEKAMISLDIIAGKFNVSGAKAQASAKGLAQELRIGVGASAESLQNLLKSGLSLDKASDLLKRFTNEAITGKSPSLSLSQAVQNLSFAYATNNSALGNMSGISENWSDITEKGRQILLKKGEALASISDEEAKYEGLIALTNLTQGSAARFTGTLIDQQAQWEQKIVNLKVAIGQGLNPLLSEFLKLISGSGLIEAIQNGIVPAMGGLTEGFKGFASWVKENQGIVVSFMKGLGVALAGLLIIGTIAGMIALFTNPLFLIAAAITALYMAWETNFLGMRDILNAVFMFVHAVITTVVMPLFAALVADVQKNWGTISAITSGLWNIVVGLFKWAMGIILGISAVMTGIITGDWKTAKEGVLKAAQLVFDGVKQTFSGIVSFLGGIGGAILQRLVAPFESAWNRIRDLMNKIKDALDFTKRHSPSVIDILNKGVSLANRAYEKLEFPMPSLSAAVAPVGALSGSGQQLNSINIDLTGAIISDEGSAQRIGERIGDSIISSLRTNVRF